MKTRRWMAHVGVALGMGMFGLAAPAQTQECPKYVGNLRGDLWEGAPDRIEVSGTFAYLGSPKKCSKPGCFSSKIAIADVSVPDEPRVVNFLRVGTLLDFTVSGDRLYHHSAFARTTAFDEYLGIIGISDPSQPVSLLNRFWIDDLFGIAVSGEIVLNATSNGLLLLDASNPSNPTEVGFLASPWRPSDLEVEGEFAYVAVPDSGLSIIDISNPSNPVQIGSWATTWEALDLEVQGGFIFVADGAGGFRVIDVTDPAAPIMVGAVGTIGEATMVSVDGTIATVVVRDSGVLIVDVSDPTNPKAAGFVEAEKTPLAVAVSGSTVFISEGTEPDTDWGGFNDGRFWVFDLSDPATPVDIASFGYRPAAMDVEAAGGKAYVASGDAGLLVFDASNPDETLQSFLDTPGYALGVTLHGDLALVADGHEGLRIIDVSDFNDLVEVGSVDTPGEARRIAVAGDHAYVADGEGGLRVIDISTPEEPVEVGAVGTPEPAVDVAVEDNFAYVADGHLRIFDVSDPTHLVEVPYPTTPALAVAISDEVLYLADICLSAYSLRSPGWPRPLASGGLFAGIVNVPTGIFASGDHVYVTTRIDRLAAGLLPAKPGAGRGPWACLEVYEIQNAHFPSCVGRWDGEGWAVAVSDDSIYLASGQPEIVILDGRCLTSYWVEIVTHNGGLHGSEWRSDVFISHEEERSVGIDFTLHTVDGEFTAEASVDAGHQGVFEDIVELLGYEGKGALEIQATDPITVTSRVYCETDPGTYGAFLKGYRYSDCHGNGTLHGLREVEGKFRTNITVTNTSNEPRKVWITLYRTDGQRLIRYSLDVGPGMVVQDVQPFKNRRCRTNIDWGFATVEGGSGILASATVIDSRTNDAVIVPLLQ